MLGAIGGGALGLGASGAALLRASSVIVVGSWEVPGGSLILGVDPLSAFFLVPLFAMGALCALYGRSYLGPRVLPAVAFNLLMVSIALILMARHAMPFLVAWEVMTILAFLLITLDHGDAEVRRAGWVYLIAGHVAALCLFGLFVTLGGRSGNTLHFGEMALAWHRTPPDQAGTLALTLALVGFGIKAGMVGLHGWLPEAHAAAPSHVSAFMSAMLIKIGIYGILRTTLLMPPEPWFGVVLMVLGVLGALLGISLALQQRDLKRILAYSSVENVGIILVGLGLGFWARAQGELGLSTLAFAGGLLHVWNHSAMKGLMFLAAGSILHGAGSKDIERLGGLLGRMRWTGPAMILGAVAMAGLPPLNGFASEWLVYRSLAGAGLGPTSPANLAAICALAALALVGALAALCFARLVGVVLLGSPRGEGAAQAHEAPLPMRLPIGALGATCIACSLGAPLLVEAQTRLLQELARASPAQVRLVVELLAPVAATSAILLVVLVATVALAVRYLPSARDTETWGCGYAAPTARMQYTGSSFAELVTARLLPAWIRSPLTVLAPQGVFPQAASLATDRVDPLTRGLYQPLLEGAGDRFARLRFLQQGSLHMYLLYVFVAAVGGLLWVALRPGLAR